MNIPIRSKLAVFFTVCKAKILVQCYQTKKKPTQKKSQRDILIDKNY